MITQSDVLREGDATHIHSIHAFNFFPLSAETSVN